jgi:ABC-type sugar transport system permease subunit
MGEWTMKASKRMLVLFLGPAILAYVLMFLYPTLRTIYFSFFKVTAFAGAEPEFRGLKNYTELFATPLFVESFEVILKWWLIGGAALYAGAFLFTLLFMTGIRFKSFWRAVLYGPNIINVVAMTTMWAQYIYSPRYGLFKSFFEAVGLDSLASYQWTALNNLFLSVLLAYVWGSIGYFFLIIQSGVERIPVDLFEAAKIDGAGTFQSFFRITLPLLRDVLRVTTVMWSITAINMFAFPKTFTPVKQPRATTTPAIYLYQLAFGSSTEGGALGGHAIGKAAAAAVMLLVLVIVVSALISQLLKERRLEY